METSSIIGQLIGSFLIVAAIALLLRDLIFGEYKPIQKDAISVLIAVLASTLVYFFVNEVFTPFYLIDGGVLFTILQVRNKYK
jgi:hypothetical protein